jgi:hypothetical protein
MLKLCVSQRRLRLREAGSIWLAQNRRLISGATAGMHRPRRQHESARFMSMMPERGRSLLESSQT